MYNFQSNAEQKAELSTENMFSTTGPIDIPTLPYKTSPTRQESTESLDITGSENFLEMEGGNHIINLELHVIVSYLLILCE